MELLQLRYFRSIARMGSVTMAANFHNVPQSAMSQALSRLEKDLGGVKLFDRKNNRITLNENGQQFLTYVDTALNALDSGINSISVKPNDFSGPIRLLVLENRRFIHSCISLFSQQYPDVDFLICHDTAGEAIADYDICITSQKNFNESKTALPFLCENVVLAVCNSHPLAQRSEVSLQDLQDERFITMGPHSSIYRLLCDSCANSGITPRIPYVCDDPYYVRKYISQDMGVALVPSVSWGGRFRENTVLIPISNPKMRLTTYLVWDNRRFQSPASIAFRKFIMNEAKDLPGNILFSR